MTDGPRHAELLAELEAAFPQVERFIVGEHPTDAEQDNGEKRQAATAVTLFVFLSPAASLKECWTEQLVAFCVDHGVIAYPTVFTPKQWKKLDAAIPPELWPRLAGPTETQAAVLELLSAERVGHPRQLRRLLLREIRSMRLLIERLRNSPAIGFQSRLSGAAAVYRRALDLFFATRGHRFTATLEAVTLLDEELADTPGLSRKQLFLYFEAVAASEQARLCQQLGTSRELRRSSLRLMDRMLVFLKGFRRHVIDRYSTRRDQIVKRAAIVAIAGAAAGLALTVVGLYLYSHRTFVPIADESVITRPGAIGVRYYRGRKLEKFVGGGVGRLSFRQRKALTKNVPENDFSILARGYLLFPDDGDFFLCSRHDDGAKVYLGDRLIIDDFIVGGGRTKCRKVTVQKGWHRLSVAFFDAAGWAELRIKVGRSEQRAKAIPAQRLCCQ